MENHYSQFEAAIFAADLDKLVTYAPGRKQTRAAMFWIYPIFYATLYFALVV